MLKHIRGRSSKAFTLVEIIVVIAILSVLTAVLVPTMTGIVTNSRQQTANANARTVFSVAKAQSVSLITSGAAYNEQSLCDAVEPELGGLIEGEFTVILDEDDNVIGATYTGPDGVLGIYPPTASDPSGTQGPGASSPPQGTPGATPVVTPAPTSTPVPTPVPTPQPTPTPTRTRPPGYPPWLPWPPW